MRILVVEDHKAIAQNLKSKLKDFYTVDLADAGEKALSLIEMHSYDLVILDLGLPDIPGDRVCRAMRDMGFKAGILVLTARWDVATKVALFDAGADDYLTKPFSTRELMARIRALTRRKNERAEPHIVQVADLRVDIDGRKVYRGRKEIRLRRKEFDLLEYLIRHQGTTVTRSMILNQLWESTSRTWESSINVHMKYLRDKVDKPFKKQLIKTIYGVGYRLDPYGTQLKRRRKEAT